MSIHKNLYSLSIQELSWMERLVIIKIILLVVEIFKYRQKDLVDWVEEASLQSRNILNSINPLLRLCLWSTYCNITLQIWSSFLTVLFLILQHLLMQQIQYTFEGKKAFPSFRGPHKRPICLDLGLMNETPKKMWLTTSWVHQQTSMSRLFPKTREIRSGTKE